MFASLDADPQLSSRLCRDNELKLWWDDQRRAILNPDMRGMRWNHSVLRVALSMYLRGPAEYSALQMTGAVKLPSGRSLKAYVSDRSPGVGPDDKNGKLLMEAYSRLKLQFGITLKTCPAQPFLTLFYETCPN